MHAQLSAHLLVQPASHHHWDIEVPLNGLISLAKAVHLPRTSGALRRRKKAEHEVRCVLALVQELTPGQTGWSETKQRRLPGSSSLTRDTANRICTGINQGEDIYFLFAHLQQWRGHNNNISGSSESAKSIWWTLIL